MTLGNFFNVKLLFCVTVSPVPDLEILLKVNLNFQVRLTTILACGIYFQENGSGSSLLKYNCSGPSLFSLINKSFLKDYLSFLTFYKGSKASFENDIDSNHRIIQGVIPVLCQGNCMCNLLKKKKTNENQSIFGFVWMLCRTDEKLFFYWFLTQTSENFSVFRSVKNTKGQTYSEPDFGMLFTGLPQKFPTYGPRQGSQSTSKLNLRGLLRCSTRS